MMGFIDWVMRQKRATLSLMGLMLVLGFFTYVEIPKEADPDIPIPFVFVSIVHQGISPEDSERLLVKPMERELRAIEGLKEMRAIAQEGNASIVLEFDVNFDAERALADVREKVDLAKAELPDDAEEPIVQELNAGLFPVIITVLSGDVPERTLFHLAREAQDALEALPNVLEANLIGHREELLEVVVDPAKLESHGISQAELINAVTLNNQLVAAGAIQGAEGRFSVKVPGLFETRDDVLGLPIRASGEGIVRVGDVSEVRRTFQDRAGYARFNGEPAIAIQVVKRIGANIIETNKEVRAVMAAEAAGWPEGVKVDFTLDQSDWIKGTLSSLEDNIIAAIALVMIVTVATLGLRSSLLVGLAIPSSFLFGFLFLGMQGLTVNMMVMFGFVLAVGILVDGATIVTEFADRKMVEGLDRQEAYRQAAKRMFWPVVSSTATTLMAFLPLLLWPGIPGKFMSYLPITLIFVLTGSLVMALVFLPVLGALFGKPRSTTSDALKALAASETGDTRTIPGITGWYARFIDRALDHRGLVLAGALALSVVVIMLYGAFNKGVEFFTQQNPEQGVVLIRARGNLSPEEMLALTLDVERRVQTVAAVKSVFTQTGQDQGLSFGDNDMPDDTIARLSIELVNFRDRPNGNLVLDEIRQKTAGLPGIIVEVRAREDGPPTGKAIQIELASENAAALQETLVRLHAHLASMDGLIDIEDSRPLPGIEWQVKVDREQAGRFGADIASVGAVVQLVTNGVKVGEYRPDDSDDEIDIRVRYPAEARGIEALDRLRVQTAQGLIPISNFAERVPAPLVYKIERVDAKRVMTLNASTVEGTLPSVKIAEVKEWIAGANLDPRVAVNFRGADEEQQQAAAFLPKAFLGALFLMAIILLVQFNSFYHTILVLSAVVFSTIGVLLGMLITGQTFSVILTGTGIVALAGIVVGNNIVLIDTYQHLRRAGFSKRDAVVRTGAQRLRPVFLTTITTIIGLLPTVLMLTVDFANREITYGDPQSLWWVQLSTAVCFGLTFATLITLVLTPVMLGMPSARELVAGVRTMRPGGAQAARRLRFALRRWLGIRPVAPAQPQTPAPGTRDTRPAPAPPQRRAAE